MMVTSTPTTHQPHSIRCHDDDDDVCGERCKYSGHLSELRNCVSQNIWRHGMVGVILQQRAVAVWRCVGSVLYGSDHLKGICTNNNQTVTTSMMATY